MNIPTIKRYLGRGVKVKHLTKTTLDHALKNPAYRGADVYVPIGEDAKESAPYLLDSRKHDDDKSFMNSVKY